MSAPGPKVLVVDIETAPFTRVIVGARRIRLRIAVEAN
jgi:hypothetical protein